MSKNGSANFLTPNEVLVRYPVLKDFMVDETLLNKLAAHKVLWGVHEGGKRLWLINEESVVYFIQYLQDTQDRRFNGKD